jgi:hypothetical protein
MISCRTGAFKSASMLSLRSWVYHRLSWGYWGVEFLLGTHAEAVVIFQFVIMVGKSLNLDVGRMKLTL